MIVPCYNEEDSIPVFFQELADFEIQFANSFSDIGLQFYFVDNNSTDRSLELLRQYQGGKYCILRCEEQGYGAALKFGFRKAASSTETQWLAFLDLDNTYPLPSLIVMLQKLQQNNLDMVYGARIHQRSQIPLVRGMGNRFYVLLSKILFKSRLSDVCSGMRIFKQSRLSPILNLQTIDLSFSIDFSVEALLGHWALGEVPIDYRERIGESKLSVLKDGFCFLFVLLKKYFYNQVRR